MTPLIEARELVRGYAAKMAVSGVSLATPRGTVAGLLGVNGAGKSTIMRLLAGYLVAESGSARIAGHDVVAASRAARAALGYLPEAPSGFPSLTVREFLVFAAAARGLSGHGRRRALDGVVATMHLGDALDLKLGSLSKGWRQRAWLAQAIIHDPQCSCSTSRRMGSTRDRRRSCTAISVRSRRTGPS